MVLPYASVHSSAAAQRLRTWHRLESPVHSFVCTCTYARGVQSYVRASARECIARCSPLILLCILPICRSLHASFLCRHYSTAMEGIAPGDRVRLVGLKKVPELNGRVRSAPSLYLSRARSLSFPPLLRPFFDNTAHMNPPTSVPLPRDSPMSMASQLVLLLSFCAHLRNVWVWHQNPTCWNLAQLT